MTRRNLTTFLATLVVCLATSGCVVIPISLPGSADVRQVVYRKGSGFDPAKIAIIDVSGVLTAGGAGDGFFSNDSSVVKLTRNLHNAKKDSDIEAIILRIDSPGGGVTASDIMYHELLKFKEETSLPIYVSMQTLAASGGYYISMAADEIYAAPTTVTGSIGVIATFPEARGLMDKIGFDMNSVTSGANKDAGAFYKEMSESDRELYQNIVDDMYGKFVEIVASNRKDIDEEKLRGLADGRVYTANQALEAGLIDGIAYLDEVVERVESDLNLGTAEVVIIKATSRERTTTLYAENGRETAAKSGAGATQVNLLHVDLNAWSMPSSEVFNYLWVP